MKKAAPYIVIVVALIAGLLLNFSFNEGFHVEVDSSTNGIQDNKIDSQYQSILIYPKKNLLPEFQLTAHDNSVFSNKDFMNVWSLIFIGYTNCPDVCPNTLNQMTQLYNSFDDDMQSKFNFVFLSVDPERDTPQHMAKYLDYFNENFVGVSGSVKNIDSLVKALGGVYSLNKEEGEFYTVDHSARIFLVGPAAERYGILESHSLKTKDKTQIVSDLTQLTSDVTK
ncbi:MAG: SCO family protein [Kangiellaceae bacterium]|nr:SCO family protein [Kangiellaceae bacterium]